MSDAPKWRRWADEKPDEGDVYLVYDGGGGSVRSWLHGSASTPAWGDDDLWMPLSEWRQVLDGIAVAEDHNGWVVRGMATVKRRDPAGGQPVGRVVVFCDDPEYVAKALNEMEGR